MIGETIAHYEITGKLGEGAMGEVYRATDTKLKRDVAIKALSWVFATDPERVARLRREAQVLASLSHANIGQIYGLETSGSSLVLVLELVEGPTLEDRLKKGPLPPDQALRIAQQIAAALEAAHESGIIHRDLKPSNIKLTVNGDVKVLDFGLAKDIQPGADKTDLTADGAVFGTPSYMSPEQVAAQKLDRRTDIWAFGCVLYELLTGAKAFQGDSIGSLFAAIATKPVDVDQIPAAPPLLRNLVERCLRKDPKSRLRDIGDARVEIEDLLTGRGAAETAAVPAAPSGSRLTLLAALALIVGAVIGGVAMWQPAAKLATSAPPPIARYSIMLPPKPSQLHLDSPTGTAPPLDVSPDGQLVVFTARDGNGVRRLYLHNAEDGKIQQLPGTDLAEAPFFSPDGRQVAFLIESTFELVRISLSDLSVQKLMSTYQIRGASWAQANVIVFGHADEGLQQITMPGGETTSLTEVADNELHDRWPQVLPDGKHVLFSAQMRDQSLEFRILSMDTGEVVRVEVQGSYVRYVRGGFLLYMKAGHVWAVRFDLATKKTVGEPARIISGVYVPKLGNPHLAISATGVLVYEPFRPPSPGRSLVWVDRSGNQEPLDEGKGYEFPRLSPDGSKVVFANHTATNSHDIWIFNVNRGTSTQFTNGGNYIEPIWSPDGETIMFGEFHMRNLCIQGLGESTARTLHERPGWQFPNQWTKAGRLYFEESTLGRAGDVLEFNFEDQSVRGLVTTVDSERSGTISPDGRWLVYVSDETGRNEVYLRSYPKLGSEEVVSREGGTEPVWSHDGSELFFRYGKTMFAVKLDGGKIGEPTPLFDGPYVEGFHARPNYDVTKDGQRFLMVDGGWGLTQGRLAVHLHFDQEIAAALGD